MPVREQDRWNTVYRQLKTELCKLLVGYEETIDFILAGLFAGGHILIEGAPGLGKTLLVRTLGAVMDLKFARIQFTPDLMPADITGTYILQDGGEKGHAFCFQKGALFANIILSDEINRATPKTQSALLEAMQEHSVTVSGNSHKLPIPFFVLATQNPIEMEGTYPLPEAQLDRFLMKLLIELPSLEGIEEILLRTTGEEEPEISHVTNGEEILFMQRLVRQVPVAPELSRYVAMLISATHPYPKESAFKKDATKKTKDKEIVPNENIIPKGVSQYVRYGASPRAAQALILAGKALALMHGRFNVSIEDILTLAYPVLRHRIIKNFEGEAEGITIDAIISELLDIIPKPSPKAPLLAATQ